MGLINIVVWLIKFFIFIFCGTIVTCFIEYTAHRYTMHFSQKWLPADIYHDHAIEHHRYKRNDINIDLPLYYSLFAMSPLILISIFLSYSFTLSLILVCYIHGYLWTKLHRGIHKLEKNWIMRTKYYETVKKHHELHHLYPKKNFGVVFWFTDNLFGTKVKEIVGSKNKKY